MTLAEILADYRILGGVFIGCATITGVSLNIFYSKYLDRQLKREKTGSIASAVAAEMLYNSYSLRQLYLEIYTQKTKKPKVTEYRHIDWEVYHELLEQIGELGSSLTFMTVDAYGDIKKVKGRMELLSDEGVMSRDKDAILRDIKKALVKTLSASLSMYLFSDYMNGRKWMRQIQEQRVIRIKRSLEGFCKFVEKTEAEIAFISTKQDGNMPFRTRFQNEDDREAILKLFVEVRRVMRGLLRADHWEAQLSIRALSYQMQNTLTRFLDMNVDEYDLMSEQEYSKFL